MIKNLIFCLLVLTGAGMLNSCQQDEVVNEALENKEIIIRASLPDDELSRVILDDNTTGATTSLYWETGDKIITTINGVDYEFEVLTIGSDRTTATFKYTNNKGQLPTGTCTFTYGATPEIGLIQDGTKDGLKNYHRMETAEVTIGDWNTVTPLQFATKVALVEISLPISTAKVSLYDANTGVRLAYTENKTFPGNKAYFALPHGTACEGFVLAETNSNTAYVAAVGQKTLYEGKLYRINNNKFSGSITPTSCGTDVKYVIYGDVVYVYGEGEIDEKAFNQTSYSSVIICNGITEIGEKAFSQISSLSTVIIPASVEKIAARAFGGCRNYSVTILAPQPPTLGEKAFGFGDSKCDIIYVPSGSVDTYKSATGWNDYKNNIQAIP